MNFIHLNYHYHNEFDHPQQVIDKHKFSGGFIDHLKEKVNFFSVKHLNYEGQETVDDISYHFFQSKNKSWYIPFKTHRFIKKIKPDVILVEGFVFPLQIIFLRRAVGKNCIIVAQHHGECPFASVK